MFVTCEGLSIPIPAKVGVKLAAVTKNKYLSKVSAVARDQVITKYLLPTLNQDSF